MSVISMQSCNFNPRSPHRERLMCQTVRNLLKKFQSTLPSQGATLLRFAPFRFILDFNPRSPHRERHYYVSLRSALFLISIHAPLTGSDYCLCFLLVIYSLFQSTLPSQGATKIVEDVTFSSDISIHAPLTGSDLGRLDRYIRYADISIHAPLTGSDFRFPARFMVFDISIHAPLTGSDIQWQLSGRCCGISIHAPLTGSDDWRQVRRIRWNISIHAPLTGSDLRNLSIFNRIPNFNPRSPHRERPSLLFRCPNLPYFNPRSPHRERRLSVTIHVHNKVFQSTLPSQGATGLETGEYIVKQISIHAPLTGSDGHEVQMVWRRSYFNPRSPHRERRRREHVVREAYKISIHAPLTGSDPVYGGWTCDADDFNPRSPHRERPPGMRYMGAAFDFNPRSPHRERLRRTQRSLWQGGFQSTLPSQGATDLRVGIYTGGSHFNPRSPHRERQQIYT